jgi:hypothetical protein
VDLAIAGDRACLGAGDQVIFVDIADPTACEWERMSGGFVFAVDGAGDRLSRGERADRDLRPRCK